MTDEIQRLAEAANGALPWKKWGPYLSERQWGTVREDYSENGNAWDYFSHDAARSRAYRWGEDGLGGISDQKQHLCFALALWNEQDPILKERLFGLTNGEGNHGEDVKEYYFYLDSTPTHSYMKYLYKYPQAAYPYEDLIRQNRERGRSQPEYELLDTGIFDENRYFDVFIEYGKAGPEEILIEVTIANRGPEAATLHVLPTIWFRNFWSWGGENEKPRLECVFQDAQYAVIQANHYKLGTRYIICEGRSTLLFTENETNHERLFGGKNASPYVKDAINNYVVHGQSTAVNPSKFGTKASAHQVLTVPAGSSKVVRLRISDVQPTFESVGISSGPLGDDFRQILASRRQEADDFYGTIIPTSLPEDEARVMRQALAGMLWSKQFYYYDINKWLEERGFDPYRRTGKPAPRNGQWHHMFNADIISMPDKWEYPWYAAWDLAFHVIALTLVDPDFGKQQLDLMLREHYMHPNGQMPAYEWNFGDVNPPVHAWATIFTYRLEEARTGEGDKSWLERCFQKLLLNFTWWVNRKDREGKNVFEGGFLGLDNIGVFDRSAALPTGGHLEQADGTAWMALFCQNMLEIACTLTNRDATYGEMAVKFLQHYLWIASSMIHAGHDTGMWDEEDGFFYDVLQLPDGQSHRLKVRSMVGLLPLCATTTVEGNFLKQHPELIDRVENFLKARPELVRFIHDSRITGHRGRVMHAILDEKNLRRVLTRMLDENEFLSPFGIRSLSRYHADHPYAFQVDGQEFRVGYLPAESDSGMFGGNSNWRGPIWMPVNALIIRALLQYYSYYGNDFRIECPTGSGNLMTLYEVAQEIARRLSSIFVRDRQEHRPVFGPSEKFQSDPFWRDYLQFYEYFHGETGMGLGASHQTGWTGLVARAIHVFATISPEQILDGEKFGFFTTASTIPDFQVSDDAIATTA